MATVDKEQSVEAGRAEGRDGPNWVVWITTVTAVLSVLLGGGALLRDYFGWEKTDPGAGRTPAGVTGAPSPGGATALTTGTSTAAPPTSGPASVHVDSLQVKAGDANKVPLPRALTGQDGLDRAIAIRCPENVAQDKQREVTYELLRRYQDLTLGVRAYSPDDPQARVRVTVYVAVRRPDDSGVDRLKRASAEAQEGKPGTLSADLSGADDLILSVTCEYPGSIVVLTGARITPA